MEAVEIVPRDEFGSCSLTLEQTSTGAVWLTQNDARVYVGPEHVINLAIALVNAGQR